MITRLRQPEPGRGPSAINPRGKGKIIVAILTSSDSQAPKDVDQEFLTFGRAPHTSKIVLLLALPVAVYEMVLAVWLIVKGFN